MICKRLILAVMLISQGFFYSTNAANKETYFDVEISKAYPTSCFYTDMADVELVPIQDEDGNTFNGYVRYANNLQEDFKAMLYKHLGEENVDQYKLGSITFVCDVPTGDILKVSYVFDNVDGAKTIDLDKLIKATDDIKTNVKLIEPTVSGIRPAKGVVSRVIYYQKVEYDPWGW